MTKLARAATLAGNAAALLAAGITYRKLGELRGKLAAVYELGYDAGQHDAAPTPRPPRAAHLRLV